MNDEKMDETIRELARDYHSPPPTPREEMWAAIQAAREEEEVFPISRWRHTRFAWGVGIAAVLMVGIGLGRLSVRPEQAAGPAAPVALEDPMPAPMVGSESGETAYRVAATQHLGQAEILLTSFRTEARAGEIDARVGVWAKDLLSTTRLLLDSPAGDDPGLKVLLEDLELVLVQLSHLPTDDATQEARQEVEMVTDAIEEGGVLPKIRTALQGGPPPALNEEEL